MKYEDIVHSTIQAIEELVQKYRVIKNGVLINTSVTFSDELNTLNNYITQLKDNYTNDDFQSLINYISTISKKQTTNPNKQDFLKNLAKTINAAALRQSAGKKIEELKEFVEQQALEIQSLNDIVNGLALAKAKLEGEKETLEKQSNTFSIQNEKMADLRQTNESLKVANTKLEDEKVKLEEEINQLREQLKKQAEERKLTIALENERRVSNVSSAHYGAIGLLNEKKSLEPNNTRDSSVRISSRFSTSTLSQSPEGRLADLIFRIRGDNAATRLRLQAIKQLVEACNDDATISPNDKIVCGHLILEWIVGEQGTIAKSIEAIVSNVSDALKMQLGAIRNFSKSEEAIAPCDLSQNKTALAALSKLYQEFYNKEPKYFPPEFVLSKNEEGGQSFRHKLGIIYNNAFTASQSTARPSLSNKPKP